MINIEYFIKKIKDVKVKDYIAIAPMIIAWMVSPFYKKQYKDYWIVCEDPYEARDNGYWMYKYLCENHPEQKSIYFIKKKSADYHKVSELGEVGEYGSIKHWIMYFLSEYNISSQKGGKPNAAICGFIELNHIFKPHNVFLQHGVIINDMLWLHADRTVLDLFITSAVPEQEFVQMYYGYPSHKIVRTGIPRFDGLHGYQVVKNRIVIMPTWRLWIGNKSDKNKEDKIDFRETEYFLAWKTFVNSHELNDLITKYDLEIIFYPHRNMQKYLSLFYDSSTKVKIASRNDYDVQELLKTSQLLITDYSSVFFDMIYMKKPVIFYQFDEVKFRKQHYQEGYFNYHDNPFGKSFDNLKEVINELECNIQNDYMLSENYLVNYGRFFPFSDNNNSQRVFNEIMKLKGE